MSKDSGQWAGHGSLAYSLVGKGINQRPLRVS